MSSASSSIRLPINAEMVVENEPGSGKGEHYEVSLYAVPRVGELIGLYTVVDKENITRSMEWKHFEVVQVLHVVEDVTRKPVRYIDSHKIVIYVKLSMERERVYM